MSIQTLMNQNFLRIDKIIQNKFETILTNQVVEEEHLDNPIFDLIGGMIYSPHAGPNDYHTMSKEDIIEALEIKKKENTELINLFNEINRERKVIISMISYNNG